MKILSFILIGMLQVIMMRDWQGQNVLVDVSRGQQVQPGNIGMYMGHNPFPNHRRPQNKPKATKPTLRLGHSQKPSLSKGGTQKLKLSK